MDLTAPALASNGLPPIVGVHSPHPHAVSFAYTVFPWSDDGEGLIAFAETPQGAAELVNGVMRREHERVSGDVGVISASAGPLSVRLVRADHVAAGRYALQRADPDTPARYLQVVVLADRNHPYRFPCLCCPDLTSTTGEWPRAFDAVAWCDDAVRCLPGRTDGAATERLTLPVRIDGEEEGRLERVTVERLDAARVRLLQAPAIGDWTSAGAIHDVGPDQIIGAQIEPGLAQFGVALERSGVASENMDAQDDAIGRLGELPGIAVTMTGAWLTVAAGGRHAARARSILRRLVRDGFANEVGSYAQPHDSDGCCSRCGSGRRL